MTAWQMASKATEITRIFLFYTLEGEGEKG
jgi:hypothetical protein